jgi:hypothetical protein
MYQEFYMSSYCLRYRYKTGHGDRECVNVNKSNYQAASSFASMVPKHIRYRPREYNKQLNKGDRCVAKEYIMGLFCTITEINQF